MLFVEFELSRHLRMWGFQLSHSSYANQASPACVALCLQRFKTFFSQRGGSSAASAVSVTREHRRQRGARIFRPHKGLANKKGVHPAPLHLRDLYCGAEATLGHYLHLGGYALE